MELVQQNKSSPKTSGLAMRSSKSSRSQDGDGFYPKTPDTRSTDEERLNLAQMDGDDSQSVMS